MYYRYLVQPQTQGASERVCQSKDVGWEDSECVNGLFSIEFMALGETTHGDGTFPRVLTLTCVTHPIEKKLYIL